MTDQEQFAGKEITIHNLLDYENSPYIINPPSQLIALLDERFKNCENLKHCKSANFYGYCDCRGILTNKLSYKPTAPSGFLQAMHEENFRASIRFIHSIRHLSVEHLGLLYAEANALRWEYEIDVLQQVQTFYNTLKQPTSQK